MFGVQCSMFPSSSLTPPQNQSIMGTVMQKQIIISMLIFAMLVSIAVPVMAGGGIVQRTLLERSRQNLQQNNLDDALDLVNHVLRQKPTLREGQLLKAEILHKRGDKQGAIKILRHILRWNDKDKEAMRLWLQVNPPVQPPNFEIHRVLAKLHRRMRSPIKRQSALVAEDYILLANQARKEKVFVRAERLVENAIRLKPDNVSYREALATIYEEQGRFQAAAEAIDRIAELKGNPPDLLLKSSQFYRKANLHDKSLERLRLAFKAAPDRQDILLDLLTAARATGNETLRFSLLEEKVGTLLTDPKYYRMRASAWLEKGEWSKALADLEKCIEPLEFEKNGEMYLVDLVRFLQSPDSAFRFVERPVLMGPVFQEDLRVLFRKAGEELLNKPRGKGSVKNFARLLINLRFPNDALRVLQQLTDKEPDAEAFYLMATVREEMGDHQLKEDHLRAAESIDPAYVPARLKLGRIYLERQSFEQANYELTGVLAADPKNFEALLLLADLFFELQNQGELDDLVEKMRSLKPDSPELAKFLERIKYQK